MANEIKQIKVGNTTYNIEPYSSYYRDGCSSFEMNSGGSLFGYGGFIDFHFFNSSGKPLNSEGTVVSTTPDYTSRIIEDSAGRIAINGNTYITWSGLTSSSITSNGTISAKSITADSLTTQSITHASDEENLKIGNYLNNAYVEFVEDVQIGSLTIDQAGKIGGITKISIGETANASATGTIAIGASAKAYGENSVAIGKSAICTGSGSVALGYKARTTGSSNIVIGNSRIYNGDWTTLVGNNTYATGTQNLVVGYNSTANGTGGTSLGYGADSKTYGISIGFGASGADSHVIAMGAWSYGYTPYSIVLGTYAKANGKTTAPYGSSSVVIGPSATSYAWNTNDTSYYTGIGNIAIGSYASVSGYANVVIGGGTSKNKLQVSGIGCIAIGHPYQTLESATGSSKAYGLGSILIGSGSVSGSGIMIRSKVDNNIYYGTYLGGTSNSSYIGSSYLVLGSPSTNYCYKTGASGSWTSASDIRDKTDIESLTGGLEFLSKITPITYVDNARTKYSEDNDKTYNEEEHKKGTKKGTRRIAGVNAQETYTAQQEVYGTDNYGAIVDWTRHDHPDEEEFDRYWVQYERFIPYLIDAVKTLDKRVKDLEEEIKMLKSS